MAEASGISPRVSGQMLAAYANPRRVCVDGLLGKGASPTCGLAPGCPAATDWLALVMYPWLARARARNADVGARVYVDDQTGWSVSEECVQDVQFLVTLTDDLGKDLRLKANDIKSRRFATCRVAAGALRSMEGPPVGDWFKDLGVLQSMKSHAPAEPRQARHKEVRARLARISRLAVPFFKRVWIAAASAVPAATYGMAAHPTPVNDLRYLRSSVNRHASRGRPMPPLTPSFTAWISLGDSTQGRWR